MKQILYIHGGMTFKNRNNYLEYLKTRTIRINRIKWSGQYLDDSLKEYQIIKPRMPCYDNSLYSDWKINFERYIEFLEDDIIIIGMSLGGIFLAKYLSENIFSKKIKTLYLIAAPFDDTLTGEDLVGGFELGNDLSMIEKNCSDINLLFSADDDVVPVSHAKKYQKKLPKAKVKIFEGKNGHFNVPEFPELIEMIKKK